MCIFGDYYATLNYESMKFWIRELCCSHITECYSPRISYEEEITHARAV